MEADIHSQHADGLSLDTTFALLRNQRRRNVVSILADGAPPVSLTELAVAVAAREQGVAPDDVPPETVDSVAATLHHFHLPKLADGGLLTYDAEEKTVTDADVEAVALLSDLGDDF